MIALLNIKSGWINMKGYVVRVYKSINDEDALKDYALKAKIAVEKFKGNFLVRGGKKITTEGDDSPRTVVIEFPSYDEANKFYKSEEYQDAHSVLKGYAERQHQTIEGA